MLLKKHSKPSKQGYQRKNEELAVSLKVFKENEGKRKQVPPNNSSLAGNVGGPGQMAMSGVDKQ